MNGWTGGQYSVYRVVLGAYLLQHFAGLLAWGPELFSSEGMLADATLSPLYPLFPNVLFALDSPIVVTLLLGLAAIAAVLFAAGFKDRACALVLWYLWACLFTRNPLIQNPSLPFIGWLLIAHSVLPRAPYGSWDARGRADPGGGWQLPDSIYAAAWIVMAIGYSYSGYTKLVSPSWVDGSAIAHILDNPLARPSFVRDLALALPTPVLQLMTWGGLALELLFAPLALVRRVRPWLWLAMLGLHLNLLVLIDFADLSFGMVILHAFTFDPSWLRARRSAGEWVVYYDGSCGLCHRTVRLLLAEDREAVFRYQSVLVQVARMKAGQRLVESIARNGVIAVGRLERAAMHIVRFCVQLVLLARNQRHSLRDFVQGAVLAPHQTRVERGDVRRVGTVHACEIRFESLHGTGTIGVYDGDFVAICRHFASISAEMDFLRGRIVGSALDLYRDFLPVFRRPGFALLIRQGDLGELELRAGKHARSRGHGLVIRGDQAELHFGDGIGGGAARYDKYQQQRCED